VLPPTRSRRLAVLGGFLWLALAALLLLLAMIAAVVSPIALVWGVLGTAAVGHAAILFTPGPHSAAAPRVSLVGLLSTLLGLWAAGRGAAFGSELILPLCRAVGTRHDRMRGCGRSIPQPVTFANAG
jgi:hypothetical protein